MLAVTLAGEGRQLTVASLHIGPPATALRKRRIVADLRTSVPRDGPGAVVIGGDFNWTSPGDFRTERPLLSQSMSQAPEARLWDAMFGDLVELHQGSDTRARLVDGLPVCNPRAD